MLKEKQDKEESVVSEQETLTIPYPETEANVSITVYMGHGKPVISGTPSPAASTTPLNTVAGMQVISGIPSPAVSTMLLNTAA